MNEPTAPNARQDLGRLASTIWWMPLLRGIFLVILGGYALFEPGMTVIALTQILGIFLIADAVITLLAALVGETASRGSTLLRGVIELLIGIFVVSNSALVAGIAGTIVLCIVAICAIFLGIMEITVANRRGDEIWPYVSGGIAILFGILILIAPLAFGALFVRLFGVIAIIQGVFLILLAFRIRGVGKALNS